ncbi:MAG: class I SAM-dependent methyltransferase [Candidatus Thorarchaeota archaeon]|nr:class I SAM-dependent methyltransferase [Candidatus Thorarchaeota archaeon]
MPAVPDSKNKNGYYNSGYEGVAEFYDFFVDNSDIPFYLDYARKAGGAVLDIASGTGRVAIELARNGSEVVALENSPSMLSVMRKKLQTQPTEIAERISIFEGSMTNFGIGKEFDLIIIPSSFGHAVATEDQLSTLRCIKSHLSPDGIFILDLFPGSLNLMPANFEDSPVTLSDGRTVIRRGVSTPHIQEQILDVGLSFEVRSEKAEKPKLTQVHSEVAIIFDREANLLVKMAGFQVDEEFGSFQYSPYSNESRRRILVLTHSK